MLHELGFHGRLSRRGFWARHLLVLPFALALVLHLSEGVAGFASALLLLTWLCSVWARRLHDRNMSGWWLLAVLVPLAGAVWLWWQCGLRGSSPAVETPTAGYLTVRS